jgi:hypothetical protein
MTENQAPDEGEKTMPTMTAKPRTAEGRPTAMQREWLKRGLKQAGGKLPLFDREGQLYPERTIKSCIERGWAEPWFNNPLKTDWLICKLTDAGRQIVSER